MSQSQRLIALAEAVAADIKDLRGRTGALADLNTTVKTNLVAAINSLLTEINNIETASGLEADGTLAAITGTNYINGQSSLLNALKALDTQLKTVADSGGGGGGAPIDDTAGAGDTDKVWSADKSTSAIATAKQAVKDEILGGAGAAYDTLKELQDLLVDADTELLALTTAVANRVRFDAAQTLDATQKTQACTNIGIGDPETDLVAAYNTAKA